MTRFLSLAGVLLVQAVCALFFVSDILLSVFGIYVPPISWQSREVLEIGAAVGLLVGLVLGAFALRRALRDTAHANEKLRRASTALRIMAGLAVAMLKVMKASSSRLSGKRVRKVSPS